jgi:signal transduction histidine kinase
LANAAKYTEAGGTCQLSCVQTHRDCVLSISDSGIGIPLDQQPQVFEMFTQVDQHLKRAQGGLGIGLALVKKMIEMHKGTITVHSEGAQKGTRFDITIPLIPRESVGIAAGDDFHKTPA